MDFLGDVHQWLDAKKLLTEGWLIFYAGLVLAALGLLFKWLWGKSTQLPPVITGEIYDDTMPVTDNGRLFGRETTLEQLDVAWSERETRVLALVAWGGVGKTSVINYWLETLKRDPERAPERIYCWSFANQGTGITETSSSAFFTHALQWFEAEKERFSSEHEKGQYLAKRMNQQRTLLVLDGLEVFQHLESELQGKLRDPALFALLQALGRGNAGLCVVATRENLEASLQQIHGIKNLPLNNLSEAAGLALLRSFELKCSDEQLLQVVRDYEGHAHSLSMLANFLRQYRKGDIQRKDTLPDLQAWMGAREANRIFAAYENELVRTPDLALLYLVSVFEKAVEPDVFNALLWALDQRQLRSFNAWLKPLLKARTRQKVLRRLQQSGLVSGEGDTLDLHPLARAYFRDSFQQHFPQTYRTAHLELYEYYKALPEKEQPDTLEEMQPLFHAVAHGCAAGLHQQALDEVYWPRIQREGEFYTCHKLGAFSDDLAVVAHFFSQPWRTPAAGLTEGDQSAALNWAGFALRALGRLREAVEPIKAGMERSAKQKDWKGAAVDASNLCELQLTLGQVAAAVDSGERSVGYADQSEDMFQCMVCHANHADALHQAGRMQEALTLYEAAEQLQQERQPAYPRLYSSPGFQYCDLLLAQGKVGEVLERTEQTLGWAKNATGVSLLDMSLIRLSLGFAYHAQGDLVQAHGWLDQAVVGLRKAGAAHHLPRGLLARAALWRDMQEWDKAHRDLAEAWDIAEPSGMRLHLTDYHLEMVRLLLAQNPHPTPSPSGRGAKDGTDVPPLHVGERGLGGEGLQYHLTEAANLIQETGYHRRDKALRDLQLKLALHGLYAITDGSTGDTLITKAEAALRGGARILQYRDKTTDTARRQQEAQQLLALCEQYGAVFVVNDDVELAQQVSAHGMHVGKDDAALSAARAALGDDAIIGVSCYNRLELAQTAQANGADYVAFGSMFASPTKPNAPRASLVLLQEAHQTLHVPICTIGGITLDNAPQLIHNGAAMIAVISELFAAEQAAIQRNAQQFSQLF